MIAVADVGAIQRAPLYDASDLPWIAALLDLVQQSIGEPWRLLLERIERARLGVSQSHRMAMLRLLGRWLGDELGGDPLDPEAAETRERAVRLLAGRPSEVELAAFGNLERLQRWVRRASRVRLRVWQPADALVRDAARRGLIVEVRRVGEATQLELVGPRALAHSTQAYGRALAAIVPRLAEHARFVLELDGELAGVAVQRRITTPILLPSAPVAPPVHPTADQLAHDLADLGYAVERTPAAITSDDVLLFPALAVQHAGARWCVEILGFSTPGSLVGKLAHYRRASQPAVLCVDHTYAPGCDLTLPVCGFARQIDAHDVVAMLRAGA